MQAPSILKNPNKPVAVALSSVALFAGGNVLAGCGVDRSPVQGTPEIATPSPNTKVLTPNEAAPKGRPTIEDKGNGVQVVTVP